MSGDAKPAVEVAAVWVLMYRKAGGRGNPVAVLRSEAEAEELKRTSLQNVIRMHDGNPVLALRHEFWVARAPLVDLAELRALSDEAVRRGMKLEGL